MPVNECLREVCPAGCINALIIGSEPALVNANGSSLVGVSASVQAQCTSCNAAESMKSGCNPDSCLHGGTCIYNAESQTTRFAIHYHLLLYYLQYILITVRVKFLNSPGGRL